LGIIGAVNQDNPDWKDENMSFLGKLFGGATAATNRVAGRTDLLEACLASAALVAAADGNISPEEVVQAIDVVKNNETLNKAFSQQDIDATMNRMISRAKGGYSGQAQLYKELREIGNDQEDAEAVYLIAVDVAFADGTCDAKERAVLTQVAKTIGVDASKWPLPPLEA
jgi:tellurite resistance protein TerB